MNETVSSRGDDVQNSMPSAEVGLLICGWVSMWRPIQIHLYDCWPIRRTRHVFEKIKSMPIETRVLAAA